jgi:glycosyltransferase involved in cell wall biosynthesis
LNAAATIEAAVESVLAAGEAVSEYLIVDGGSTDGTLAVLESFEPSFAGRLRWISEPDDGLYFAMNRGIELATGTHLLFLGADDLLVAGALERVIAAAGEGDEADLVFGDVRVVEPNGTKRLERACATPGRIGQLPRAMPVCHQATIFSANAYRMLGGFDTSFRIAADYEFYLRFSEAGLRALYVPVVVAEYSLGGVSATRGTATAQEYRRAWVAHGVSPARAWARMVLSLVNLRVMGVWRRLSRTER